jgi:cysteine desulfurase family protein (TIGR01976 family)
MPAVFDPAPLRAQFSSLQQTFDGQPAIFFDNPGGTQVPDTVIEAVADYYRTRNANVGGAFATSRRTDETVWVARRAVADLLNAPDPATIVFGASMTALTFHLARSFGHTIRPGDEIIVTNLDHDANVAPWTDLAANGASIRIVDINTNDGTLDMAGLENALSPRTRFVAVTHASNAIGTVPDVRRIVEMAHRTGALVFVDAVQYAPHGPIDVQALDCDFLACSAYKFFGPHVGALYGKRDTWKRLTAAQGPPAKDAIPYRWETGTLNHEGLAGVAAAVDYMAGIGEQFGGPWREGCAAQGYTDRRLALKTGLHAIRAYEKTLSARLLSGLATLPDVTVYGLTDQARLDERVPTVAFTWPRLTPRATVEYLGDHGVCCWSGNYYALRLMERLGLEAAGGAVRIGCAHYNTPGEIDRLVALLHDVPVR